MNKEYTESSNDEETYKDYFSNPLKRKQFDNGRLYQQQKELSKMSGFNKQIIDAPKKLKESAQQKNYAVVSLCCLTVTNPFRDVVIRIVMNNWFDRFILLVIVSNCVFLAVDNPAAPATQLQSVADQIFLIIYTLEMVLKIIAMGFLLRPHSYLRDPWNVLDFVVVMMGWISGQINSENVSAIRVVRILRPLRTINSLKGMRALVGSLLNSLPTLFDILILFLFVLIMCGTVGTQLFQGSLLNRCLVELPGNERMFPLDELGIEVEYKCSSNSTCPVGSLCLDYGNPNFGVTSFDNIFISVLNVFIIITLEGWTDTMYMIRESTNSITYDAFFLLCVVFGTFFVLNLMIAVQFSFLQASLDESEKKYVDDDDDEDDEDDSQDEKNQGPKDGDSEVSPDQAAGESKKKKRICQCWFDLSHRIFVLVDSQCFQICVVFLILINTFFLALEHHDMQPKLQTALELGNTIFTVLFACEMVLKLIGLGIVLYVKDGFNDFDAVIVLVSLLEFTSIDAAGVTVLRSFRLLRIFKIINSWPTLKKLLQTVIASFAQITYLGLLMFLLIFIYALIGMQFFNEQMEDGDGEISRYTFHTFGWSLITIFILLTGENWNEIMYIVIKNYGFGACFYFVSLMVFGNFMLLNLFLAILLKYIQDNVSDDMAIKEDGEDEEDSLGDDDLDLIQRTIKEQNKTSFGLNLQKAGEGEEEMANVNEISVNFNKSNQQELHNAHLGGMQKIGDLPSATGSKSQVDQFKSIQMAKQAQKKKGNKSRDYYKIEIEGKSFFILPVGNCCRTKLKSFVEHPYFENMIYYFIALNSLMLALDSPTLLEGYQKQSISILVIVISLVFVVEAVLKIIVMGFLFGPLAYLKDTWNVLDFVIVVFTLLNWVLASQTDANVGFLRGFRALRALRPLRMVSKNEGMKTVVNSLLKSIPQLFNVLLISVLFYLVFGILGVQIFKGAIGECTDLNIDYKVDCFGPFFNSVAGENEEREWVVQFNNYDNIIFAMVTFFEVSTLEMWPDVMFRAIDSTEPDRGPKLNNRPVVSILFVIFIFITTFFVMNLFISVIVDKFNEEIKRKEGAHNFTDEQKEWVKMQRIMVTVKVKRKATPPKQRCRKGFFSLVQSPKFEYAIALAIVLNTILLCMEYYDAPETYQMWLGIGNNVFVAIFFAECVLKLIGYGPSFYFHENWNIFDFMIVCSSVFSLNAALAEGFNVTALRIIRVARLLRMIRTSKGLRHLLKTLWLSLSNILNVTMLLFLILFTFAVAGMDLFGGNDFGDFYNENANFTTFYMSVMCLVRASTGESWNGIMHDNYDQSGPIAIFFWLVFILVSFFVFLNVFIAVIYENFNDIKSSEDANEVLSLKRKDIKSFVRAWAVFNRGGALYMKTSRFPAFLVELPPPLGYKNINIEPSKLNKIIFCLNIRDHKGKVYFPEVMWAIFHSIIGNNDEKVHKCDQVINIMKILKRKYKGLGKNVTPDSLCGNKFYKNEMTVSKYLSAIKIVERWRKTKKAREEGIVVPQFSLGQVVDLKLAAVAAQVEQPLVLALPAEQEASVQENGQNQVSNELLEGLDIQESSDQSISQKEMSGEPAELKIAKKSEDRAEVGQQDLDDGEEEKRADREEEEVKNIDEEASDQSARGHKLQLQSRHAHDNFTVLKTGQPSGRKRE